MQEIPLPLKGLSKGLPVANEEAATSGYMSNVRPRDVLEGRLRLGQRPGLKKAYSQQIGNVAMPVVFIGFITVVE